MLHAVRMRTLPTPVQEPPCARTAPWFRGRILTPLFFYHGIGFFMVLVDAGRVTIHSPPRINSNHPEPTRNPP